MIRFDIRNPLGSDKYVNCEVVVNDVRIDLGMLDDKERRVLAYQLVQAASELLDKDA